MDELELPPVGYAYGAVAPAGALLFTAGACPLASDGTVVGAREGDVARQAEQTMTNLVAVLRRHGAGPEHLVKTTVYVVGDRYDLMTAWDVVAATLSPYDPPSTLLGVSVLGYAGQLVEVEAIAALPGPAT